MMVLMQYLVSYGLLVMRNMLKLQIGQYISANWLIGIVLGCQNACLLVILCLSLMLLIFLHEKINLSLGGKDLCNQEKGFHPHFGEYMMLVGMDPVVGLLGYITLVIFKNYHKKFFFISHCCQLARSCTQQDNCPILISCDLEFLAGKTEWCAHVVINSINHLQGACPKARKCTFNTLQVVNEGAHFNTIMGAILGRTTTNSQHFDA